MPILHKFSIAQMFIYLPYKYHDKKMAIKRWKHNNTTVYNIGYHLIWCPKYRRKVLTGKIEKELTKSLKEKAKEISINIEKLEIMPDHIHLFVKAKPTQAINWIVQQLKGYTSRKLREKFKMLTTIMPSLWTRSYYVETVGHISEETIKKYIEEQKRK